MKTGFGSSILALLLVSSVLIPTALASAEKCQSHHQSNTNHAFVPRMMSTTISPPTTAGTLLKLRGGAGPINPDTMCKIVAGVAIYQGVAGAVAPKQMNEAYGFSDKDNDALQQFHMKHYGTGILSQGIMVYLMFFKDASLAEATQASSILWAYETMRDVADGSTVEVFGSNEGSKFAALIHLISVFAMSSTDYSEIAMKAIYIFWGLNGLIWMFNPESAIQAWGIKKKLPDNARSRVITNTREFGTFLISTCIYAGSQLFFDASATQAVGYATIPWMLSNVKNMLNGTYSKLNIGIDKVIPWLIYQVVVIGTLLL